MVLIELILDVCVVMFVQLLLGSELCLYCDLFVGLLCLYLGLSMFNDDVCYIEVDGIKKSWCDGEWMMFDEIYIYYVYNEMQQDCVILFCDIVCLLCFGLLGLFNCVVVVMLLVGGVLLNLLGDLIGGVNKVFGSVYKVCLKVKVLCECSVVVYQLIKWGLVVVVIVGIWVF